MSLLNKLFKTKNKSFVAKAMEDKKEPSEKKAAPVSVAMPAPAKVKTDLKSKILFPHTTEKALNGQKFNQYVFKVSTAANKIMIASEVKRAYNVKVANVNIINIPRKARRVGRTIGFKKGYKKAVVTLASGQTIEIAK